MKVRTIAEQECWRLVCANARFAVIEVRNGRVYSMQRHARREGPDTAAGISAAIGDGWGSEGQARSLFEALCRGERHYAEMLW